MNSRTRSFGKSVLELSLNDKVSKPLKVFEARLRELGTRVTGIGKGFAKIGAAILGPLAGAAKLFASTGDELNKMAARTGFSAQALSELNHAAQASGTDLQTVEKAARGMARNLLAAEQGSKGAIDKLTELGLTVDDLQGKSPEQQFELLANRIAAIQDPTRRAAASMAIFGKAGSDLLPLLQGGADGMNALRQEARDLGITMNDEDATAAAALTDAFGRLQAQLKAIVVRIGAAVSGPLLQLADRVRDNLTHAINWVRLNGDLIVSIAKIGTTVTAIGAAVIGIGSAFNIAANAVGGLSAVFSILLAHPVAAAMTAVGAAVALMASEYRRATDAVTDFDEALNKNRSRRTSRDAGELDSLSKRFEQLAKKTKLSAAEADEARQIIIALRTEFGNLAGVVKNGKIAFADKTLAQLQAARSGRSQLAQSSDINNAQLSLDVRIQEGAGAREIDERRQAIAAMREELQRTQRIIADAKPLAPGELPKLIATPEAAKAAGKQLGTDLGQAIIDRMRELLDDSGDVFGGLIEEGGTLIEQAVKKLKELTGQENPQLGVESFIKPTLPQQAVFDTTFAGQQFGRGRNEDTELLRDLAESNRAINDKLNPGIPVS